MEDDHGLSTWLEYLKEKERQAREFKNAYYRALEEERLASKTPEELKENRIKKSQDLYPMLQTMVNDIVGIIDHMARIVFRDDTLYKDGSYFCVTYKVGADNSMQITSSFSYLFPPRDIYFKDYDILTWQFEGEDALGKYFVSAAAKLMIAEYLSNSWYRVSWVAYNNPYVRHSISDGKYDNLILYLPDFYTGIV